MTYKTFKRKIFTLLKHPKVLILKFWQRFEPIVSDEMFIRVIFRLKVGYWPNLEFPRSFSEKLQWLKLYYKRPEYTEMVDKVAAKDYVARKVGKKYIIPTIGVWENINDIDWNMFPNKFVLKTTHDSGGIVVCKDKTLLDKHEVKALLCGAGKKDYTKYNKEYVYKDVPHRFIAEELLENGEDKDLPDYKFYCFNGSPFYCQVIRDRSTHETIDFYDMNWNHQDFVGLNIGVRNGTKPVDKPICLDDMISVCKTLAVGIPFVRIDFYVVNGCPYFGEITFYPNSGFGKFTPDIWNDKIGDLLILPKLEE